jgi:predicted glycoside hydrolase/deacetylase ChbG (UPF0249 family)
MRMIRLVVSTALVLSFVRASSPATGHPDRKGTVIVRCDDIGMCHTVNTVFTEVLKTGIPVSASVMFACPWYQEAVDILKQAPDVSVGVHLTLNAEWKDYRWGPVAGRSAVPSLVDSEGFFFPSGDLLLAHHPSTEEVEHELRAQIDRAIHTGLHVDYVDYHMGTAVSTPELRAIVEKLAREYHLGISRYFGETDVAGWYPVPPEAKKDTVLKKLGEVQPGSVGLMVFHIGATTPEMNALVDMNAFGLKEIARHRAAEFHALTSPEFLREAHQRGLELLTYRELIRRMGLDTMKAPAAAD